MADARIVAGLKRFLKKAEIEAVYREALEAYQERNSEVVITSVSFEGGSSNGILSGDPAVLMDACEEVLRCLEAEENGVDPLSLVGSSHVNFATRVLES